MGKTKRTMATLVPAMTTENLWRTATERWHEGLQGPLLEGLCLGLSGHGCIPRYKGIGSVSGIAVCVLSSLSLWDRNNSKKMHFLYSCCGQAGRLGKELKE